MLEYVLTDEGADIIGKDLRDRLAGGQVGILPTDTVYGLVCVSGNKAGRLRIYDMKRRERGKPMQFLLGGLDQCKWLDIPVSNQLRKLAEAFWPGPLTIVVANAGGDYHGIRVPDHDFLRKLITELGKPLAASSANLAGQNPAESAEHAFEDLHGEPDFVLLEGPVTHLSSTVIRLLEDSSFEVLREGAISERRIREALET